MIEIHTLTAVFAVEAIAVLLLALGLMLFFSRRRKRGEHGQAQALVARINATEVSRMRHLDSELPELVERLPEGIRQETLALVSRQEKALYRQVIQAFLTRDAEKLADLEQYVQGVSVPYLQLLQQLDAQLPNTESAEKLSVIEQQLQASVAESQRLRGENEQLQEQLKLSLDSLDEVSKEYARMFGHADSAEELQVSREKMMAAFRRSENLANAGLPLDHESPAGADVAESA